ncbi:hypothetical protein STH8232_0634 [Streptococcus thermophilus JIM 8232]|nr:hypothetical protein STH8232_0634 [Streptococcus thermophilus JIM 8232]
MTFKSKDGVYILAHASADFGYEIRLRKLVTIKATGQKRILIS